MIWLFCAYYPVDRISAVIFQQLRQRLYQIKTVLINVVPDIKTDLLDAVIISVLIKNPQNDHCQVVDNIDCPPIVVVR